jgi:mannitol-specific phosphotransferase system IIBC component
VMHSVSSIGMLTNRSCMSRVISLWLSIMISFYISMTILATSRHKCAKSQTMHNMNALKCAQLLGIKFQGDYSEGDNTEHKVSIVSCVFVESV